MFRTYLSWLVLVYLQLLFDVVWMKYLNQTLDWHTGHCLEPFPMCCKDDTGNQGSGLDGEHKSTGMIEEHDKDSGMALLVRGGIRTDNCNNYEKFPPKNLSLQACMEICNIFKRKAETQFHWVSSPASPLLYQNKSVPITAHKCRTIERFDNVSSKTLPHWQGLQQRWKIIAKPTVLAEWHDIWSWCVSISYIIQCLDIQHSCRRWFAKCMSLVKQGAGWILHMILWLHLQQVSKQTCTEHSSLQMWAINIMMHYPPLQETSVWNQCLHFCWCKVFLSDVLTCFLKLCKILDHCNTAALLFCPSLDIQQCSWRWATAGSSNGYRNVIQVKAVTFSPCQSSGNASSWST